jgi:hypothetical protein
MTAMDKTYAIIWTTREGFRSGVGNKRFSKDEAEALANRLNQEHSGFLHRTIDMATEDPATVLLAMRSAAREQIIDFPAVVAAQAAVA